MRLSKVVAYDPQTKEKQIFTFGTAIEGKGVVTSKGGRLNSYLEFCFREDADNTRDVEVEFLVDADEYSLGRIHGEDGTTRTILKKKGRRSLAGCRSLQIGGIPAIDTERKSC